MGHKVSAFEASIVDIETVLTLRLKNQDSQYARFKAFSESILETERVALRTTIAVISQALNEVHGDSYAIKNPDFVAKLVAQTKPKIDEAISTLKAGMQAK